MVLQAIGISFFGGILFGLSLFIAEKVIFTTKNPILAGIFSTLRLILLSIFFYIMLKSNQIHPIILVCSFLSAYWLTIIKYKEFMHAGS